MEEIWMPITGQPNYLISNFGNVKALEKTVRSAKNGYCVHHYPEYIMRPCVIKKKYSNYLIIMLAGRKRYYIHRLIAMAFIPNPENKRCINHKDGNGRNNSLDNIEWNTYSENQHHAILVLGRISSANQHLILNIETGIFYDSTMKAYISTSKTITYGHFNHSIINYDNLPFKRV